MTLEEPPLVLMRSTPEHLTGVLNAIESSLPELGRWLPFAARMPTEAEEREVLADALIAFDGDVDWMYTIIDLSAEVVGSAALHCRPESSCAEVGYWVRTERTGRGYATLAARMLVDAVFGHLPRVSCVQIRMDEANIASAAIPRKLGFVLDHHEDRPVQTSGQTGRGMIWSLTRERWTAQGLPGQGR